MADQKVYINQLPPVNINETALIPVFQGGTTSKATAGDIIKMATAELDGKLSYIEGNLSSQITVNSEKLESKFNKEITDINGQVTELETSITQTAEQIKLEAKKEIEGVKKEIASLTVEADKITSLVERIENVEGETVINRSKIEQQADSIKSTVEYLDSTTKKISTIEQTAEQIQAQVQSNDDQLGKLTLRADSFETVIAETNSNVQGFADTVSQMNHDIAAQATRLDDIKGTVSAHGTSILQTSTAISTLAARVQYDEATGTITNISKSGLLTTADGNKLYTTKEEFNLNSERLLTCEASITTTAEQIQTLVQKIHFDPATGEITNISKAGIITTSEGNEMFASKTAFNDLGERVGYAETSITQNANQIVLRATKDELVAADQQIRADLQGAIETASSNASSMISQLNESLNQNIASVNSSINSLSGELVNVENELLKDISNLGDSMDGKLSDLEGQVDVKLLEQQTTINQNAEQISLNASELTAYITANNARVLACESDIAVNAQGISAITSAIVFNDAGEITNFARAGLVTESTYATLFAQYVEAGTGGVVKQAQISAFITKNDMDEAISNIKLSADQIIFEGTTCINGNFVVDTDGNLTINGTINADSGTIGGLTINKYSITSVDDQGYIQFSKNNEEDTVKIGSRESDWYSLAMINANTSNCCGISCTVWNDGTILSGSTTAGYFHGLGKHRGLFVAGGADLSGDPYSDKYVQIDDLRVGSYWSSTNYSVPQTLLHMTNDNKYTLPELNVDGVIVFAYGNGKIKGKIINSDDSDQDTFEDTNRYGHKGSSIFISKSNGYWVHFKCN